MKAIFAYAALSLAAFAMAAVIAAFLHEGVARVAPLLSTLLSGQP